MTCWTLRNLVRYYRLFRGLSRQPRQSTQLRTTLNRQCRYLVAGLYHLLSSILERRSFLLRPYWLLYRHQSL